MKGRCTGLGSKVTGRKEYTESRWKDKTIMSKNRLERGRRENATERRKEKHQR